VGETVGISVGVATLGVTGFLGVGLVRGLVDVFAGEGSRTFVRRVLGTISYKSAKVH